MLTHSISSLQNFARVYNLKKVTRTCCLFQNRNFSRTSIYNNDESVVKRQSNFFDKRKPVKEPKTKPVLKNFFVNRLDKDMCQYPEVLPKAQYQELSCMEIATIDFMEKEVNSELIDKEGKIPKENIQAMKDLGLFALAIPEKYGGLEFNETACLKIMEVIGKDGSLLNKLGSHNKVVQMLMLFGTEEQKQLYLPRLATGELIGALAEKDGTKELSYDDQLTSASHCIEDHSQFLINGTKHFSVTDANLYVVVARTSSDTTRVSGAFSILLVDATDGKVKVKSSESLSGSKAVQLGKLHFDHVTTPVQGLIGKKGNAVFMLEKMNYDSNLSVSAGIAGILRQLLQLVGLDVRNSEQYGLLSSKFGLLQEDVSLLFGDLYVIESMVYYTAGILDTFEGPDATLECLACQIYSIERSRKHLAKFYSYFEEKGEMENAKLVDRWLRDCLSATMFSQRLEISKTTLAYLGFHHCKQNFADAVFERRNPLLHPSAALKRFSFKQLLANSKVHKRNQNVYQFYHPSLERECDHLDFGLQDFYEILEDVLSKFGSDIMAPEYQAVAGNVSDIAITLFSMMTTISRASRAYCMGHPNSDLEMHMASWHSYVCAGCLESDFKKLDNFITRNHAAHHHYCSNEAILEKGYSIPHPTFKHLF